MATRLEPGSQILEVIIPVFPASLRIAVILMIVVFQCVFLFIDDSQGLKM